MIDSTGSERRGHKRIDITQRALIFIGDSRRIEAELLNVSQVGIRFRSSIAFEVGSTVTISSSWGSETRATVRWCNGDTYGCEFENALRHQDVETAFPSTVMVRMQEQSGKLQPALMGALGLVISAVIAFRLLIH